MADANLSRRNVLILAGAAVAASAIPLAVSMSEPEQIGLENSLTDLMADRDAIALIGRRWMEEGGGHSNVAALSRRIAKKLRAEGWSPDAAPGEARAAMARIVRADFANDDMVLVDNWALSRSCVELCALAALMTEDDAGEGARDGARDGAEGAAAAPHG
ncbi:hypothetical protein FHS78_001809 [Parvibaculum indicum]|uniref:hypothetical protein n=1 Tax=Parvibaculum indicum TaxID=562969 RepID=UPI0014215E7D|nr:hypothetical protein [Parvibaculum indicum]NIJ41519.1 hypothetical protein [Parvibaculum indicum]